jgi:hypothetical protein
VDTDEHRFHQEALDTLSFIVAAAQYRGDVARFAPGVGLPGIRDDIGPLRDYFRDSPEWETNISIRLTSERQRCNASGHR